MGMLLFEPTPLSVAVRQLFASGEQGIWLDPSDFSTLFQDAAGTTPVTAVGQPVGLALDKRLALGAELVSNGDFDNADGWVLQPEVTISGGSLNYATTVTRLATATGASCVSGKWYVIEFDLISFTSGVPRFDGGGGATNISTTLGHKRYIRQATGTNDFFFTCSSAGATFSVDNISVRELPGNHAYQTTAASRPTLQQDSNGLYYLSFDGVDDGMATPSINFTGTDKMTVWAGAKSNSTAANAVLFELSTTFGAGNPGSMGVLWPRLPYAVNFGLAGTAAASRSTSASADTGLRVISCAFDISASATVDEVKPRANGAVPSLLTIDAGPAGTGNYGNYPLYIGRRGGTTLPFNGRIYQLIIRGAASSDGQIAAGEAWVNGKTRAY